MSYLTLHPGPRLVYSRWDSKADEPGWVERDVSSCAHEHLFDELRVADDVTFADLVGLLFSCPTLQQVYRRWRASEFAAEAAKGVSPDFRPGYDPQGIEFLELYQVWSYDSATKRHQSHHRWNFHGIGYELTEPQPSSGFTAGSRIPWGLSAADIRELLPLPLRINTQVPVCEEDLDSQHYGQVLETVEVAQPTLGQVLDGVLWELSFFGGPAQRQELAVELTSPAEVSDDSLEGSETLALDAQAVDDWYAKGVDKCFEDRAGLSAAEITRGLRAAADDKPAPSAVVEAFGEEVRLRAAFTGMTARELRRVMRLANDE